jgi:hypothetical protein
MKKNIRVSLAELVRRTHKARSAARPAQAPPPFRHWHPDALILALQYCRHDEAKALRLARLLADIETERRGDVVLALCRSADCKLSSAAKRTAQYCHAKFPAVMVIQSNRAGNGHPDGPNQQWISFMETIAAERSVGRVHAEHVFTFEPDCVPLSRDWIDRLMAEQHLTIQQGKSITAAVMRHTDHQVQHPNGNLLMHLPYFTDHPSLHQTPPTEAWDMHHRVTLLAATRPSTIIANRHESTGWTLQLLRNLATESAWLHGFRDDVPWKFARSLVGKRGGGR